MIDKTEIECRFRRSVDSYEDNATVQKWIVQRLVELLQEYVPYSSRTLEIGCGTGLLSEKINRLWEDQQFWVNDLVEQMCRKTIDRCQLPVSHGLNGDIEQIPLTGKFDLIVSASTFQWLAHPRAIFAKLAAHLNTNGWLIFSTFGKNNFKELKAVTGQGLEYRSRLQNRAVLLFIGLAPLAAELDIRPVEVQNLGVLRVCGEIKPQLVDGKIERHQL